MTYPNVEREARRHVTRHGEDAIVYNYSQTGTDDFGDPVFSESSITTSMLFSIPGGGTNDESEAYQSESSSPSIRIPDDVTVRPASEGNPKATVIERVRTGEQYKVQTTVDDRTGVLQVNAETND